MNLNKVFLIGRLTRDPEMRSTNTGQNVTSISLATGRTYTDKNGQKQEQTEYHNLVLWGRTAEIANQYLIKGQECCFEGRLQTRSYTGKDGVERRVTEVVVENMQMGQKPKNAPYEGVPAGTMKRPSNPTTAATNKNANGSQPKEEDLPTINLDDEKDEIRIEDVPF